MHCRGFIDFARHYTSEHARHGVALGKLVAPHISTDAQRIAELEQRVADAKLSADNGWMLVSAALVLLMTGPGLALFYGGLVRKKNVLATMLQNFAMMSLITILWGIFGYSLAFGSGNRFIGGFGYSFLPGVGDDPNSSYAPTIPHLTFMIYQLMFAVITPALITGAFAERMKLNPRDACHPVCSGQGHRPPGFPGAGDSGARSLAARRGRVRLGDFHVATGFSSGVVPF